MRGFGLFPLALRSHSPLSNTGMAFVHPARLTFLCRWGGEEARNAYLMLDTTSSNEIYGQITPNSTFQLLLTYTRNNENKIKIETVIDQGQQSENRDCPM